MSAPENQPNSVTTRSSRWTPTWIILLALVLGYFGIVYVDDRGAAFSKTVYTPWTSDSDFLKLLPPKDPMMDLGREVFAVACATCHQNSGLGTPGQFPPLVGSEWVLAEGPNRIIRIVLNGAMGDITVKGANYNNVMPPWRDALDDKKIAAVLTYIRNHPDWGHKASPVKPDQVAKIRKETADRASGWNGADLLKISDKDEAPAPAKK